MNTVKYYLGTKGRKEQGALLLFCHPERSESASAAEGPRWQVLLFLPLPTTGRNAGRLESLATGTSHFVQEYFVKDMWVPANEVLQLRSRTRCAQDDREKKQHLAHRPFLSLVLRFGRRGRAPVLAVAALLSPFMPTAKSATELPAAPAAIIEEVSFDQNLGAQVPLEATFRDEQGHAVTLGAVLKRQAHPAVLVMGYHECPMLCSLVLSGLVESFNDLRMTAGEQFEVIDVSIKPGEDTALAAAQKRIYLKRYGRGTGAGAGWHFLTGDESSIHQLTDTIGFHYAYDAVAKQYAHASGIVILTPDGRAARYFFGVNYDPRELQAALTSAGAREISSPIEKLLLLCFHYNPINGKYGVLIMRAMRVGGALTLVAVVCFLGVLIRRERQLPATRP